MSSLAEPVAPLLPDYPVRILLPIQWGEQDLYGHVNNIIYFRWFESARVAYGDRLEFPKLLIERRFGPILAAVNCNFRRQLKYPDTVCVGARITRLGRTSLTMDHAVASQTTGEVAAEGSSTVVLFDYATQQPTPLPDDLRAKIATLEGRAL